LIQNTILVRSLCQNKTNLILYNTVAYGNIVHDVDKGLGAQLIWYMVMSISIIREKYVYIFIYTFNKDYESITY
jgi:hypothetical protein